MKDNLLSSSISPAESTEEKDKTPKDKKES